MGGFPILETKRLYLRKITIDDAEDLLEYLSRDIVTRYLGKESLQNLEEAISIIKGCENNFNENRGIRWAILNKSNNKFVIKKRNL
ncbi:GNAT family N-acetyltransferase [Clostridium sp.]|uniref:GNAT family N-acetyltransferase n=1 Tax=Clostridium sp. TaxID=1506 RepID=UPI002A846D59|nr:GNAT family N-acetyltransferase [Clostridium sp.]